MSIQVAPTTFRRRGTDHLGFLGAKLRDLTGFATLAHELIQNADDAPGTTSMTFDVRDDALIVDNDGTFTDCEQLDEFECPWKQDGRGSMCDFHRFQNVASGDKRDELNTTGAFGIGFTAVYQITDRPELISSGRHWVIDELQPESRRIAECADDHCPICHDSSLPQTRFILPWVVDAESPLRKRLRVPALEPRGLVAELLRAVPLAMLFLKKLERISVLRSGKKVGGYERIVDGDSLIISHGKTDAVWHIVRSNFSTVAAGLHAQHPGRIESKRSSDVALAVPAEWIDNGVFCAFLPTQQRTGLPFHINADFFPKSDRKEIVLESDFQSEWNRAAIAAAAEGLANKLEWLRDRIGHRQLWKIVEAAEKVSRDAEAGQRDKALGYFWGNLHTCLRTAQIVYTSQGQWTTAADALFLEREEETKCLRVMEGLGLRIVHGDLRFAQNLITSKVVGVQLLDGGRFASALQRSGLDRRTESAALPKCLKASGALQKLWDQVARLLEQGSRRGRTHLDEIREQLARCAIAPARDGSYRPCIDAFRADETTIRLFGNVLPKIAWLDREASSVEALQQLCPLHHHAERGANSPSNWRSCRSSTCWGCPVRRSNTPHPSLPPVLRRRSSDRRID
jgi:hypothetical protein